MNERIARLSAMVILLSIMAMLVGCFTAATARTTKTMPDGTVTESYVKVIGTGDKVSQMAAEGLFADGTDEDLGAGVKKASASQQSTGIDGTLVGMGTMFTGLATLVDKIRAGGGVPALIPSTPPVVVPVDGGSDDTLADTAVTSSALKAKIAEAKTSGKPLVVLAGNTGCSYCERMDDILRVSPQFTGRTDIVFYRETSPWSSNQAAKWTGSGSGTFPVLRVTQWDSAGGIVCDKTVNRPQSVADIEAALSTCQVK